MAVNEQLLCYGKKDDANVYWRIATAAGVLSAEKSFASGFTLTAGGKDGIGDLFLRAHPTDIDKVMCLLGDQQDERAVVEYNAATDTWSAVTSLTTSEPNGGVGKKDHIAHISYEKSTGHVLVVYTDGTDILYATHDGTSWTTGTVYQSGRVLGYVWLEADPNSDKILMGYSDNSGNAYANVWSGTAWGTERSLGTCDFVTTRQTQPIVTAFEGTSGDGLVIWLNGTDTINYQTFTGSTDTWGTTTAIGTTGMSYTPGTKGGGVMAAGDREGSGGTHDRIIVAVGSFNTKDMYGIMWTGSTFDASWTTMETSLAAGKGHGFDVAWEKHTTDTGVAAWDSKSTGSLGVHHKTWTPSTWAANVTLGGPTNKSGWGVDICKDPASRRMGIISGDKNSKTEYWYFMKNTGSWSVGPTSIPATATLGKLKPFAIVFFDGTNSGGGLGNQTFILADAMSSTDVVSMSKTTTEPETFSGVETITMGKTLLVLDTLVGSEVVLLTKDLVMAESMTGVETVTMSKTLIVPDVFAGSDLAVVVKELLLTESTSGSDIIVTGKDIINVDTLIFADTLTFVKKLFLAETAIFSDVLVQIKNAILGESFNNSDVVLNDKEYLLGESLSFLKTEYQQLVDTTGRKSNGLHKIGQRITFTGLPQVRKIKVKLSGGNFTSGTVQGKIYKDATVTSETIVSNSNEILNLADQSTNSLLEFTFPDYAPESVEYVIGVEFVNPSKSVGLFFATPQSEAGVFSNRVDAGSWRDYSAEDMFGDILVLEQIVTSKGIINVDSINYNDGVLLDKVLTFGETLNGSDVLTVIKPVNFVLPDVIAYTESTVISKDIFGSDNFSGADAVLNDKVFVISESSNFTDILQTIKDNILADVLVGIDSNVVGKSFTFSDNVNYSESFVKEVSLILVESFTGLDTLVQGKNIIINDTFNGVDSLITGKDLILTESFVMNEVLISVKDLLFAEGISYADLLDIAKANLFTESFTVSDLVITSKDILLSESLGFADILINGKDIIQAESFVMNDILINIKDIIVSESIGYSDILNAGKVNLLIEALSMSDTLTTIKDIVLGENVSYNDALLVGKDMIFSEALTMMDILVSSKDTVLSEAINWNDDIFVSREQVLGEATNFADVVQTAKELIFSDGINYVDGFSISKELIFAQTIGLSDLLQTSKDIIFADSMSSSETLTRVKILQFAESFIGTDIVIQNAQGNDFVFADGFTGTDVVKLSKTIIFGDVFGAVESVLRSKDITIQDNFVGTDLVKTAKGIIVNGVLATNDVLKITKAFINGDNMVSTDVIKMSKSLIIGDSVNYVASIILGKNIVLFEGMGMTEVFKTFKDIILQDSINYNDNLIHKILKRLGLTNVRLIRKTTEASLTRKDIRMRLNRMTVRAKTLRNTVKTKLAKFTTKTKV